MPFCMLKVFIFNVYFINFCSILMIFSGSGLLPRFTLNTCLYNRWQTLKNFIFTSDRFVIDTKKKKKLNKIK
jgi:uncharacterized membrane protein